MLQCYVTGVTEEECAFKEDVNEKHETSIALLQFCSSYKDGGYSVML